MGHWDMCCRCAAACAVLSAAAATARADFITVPYLQVGGFFGAPMPPAVPAMPDNDPVFQNYFVGQTVLPGGVLLPERRAFFAFDLSGVTIPAGDMVVSVTLGLTNVFGGVSANFSGGMEIVEFSSTGTPFPAIVDPAGTGTDPLMIFDDFGMGAFYGAVEFDAAGPPSGPVDVPLTPPGMADVIASIGSPMPFVISSKLLTFDPAPGVVREFAFGFTDLVVGGVPTSFPPVTLEIETAPIPAPAGPTVLGLAVLRRRRR